MDPRPYPGVELSEVYHKLESGYRMEAPEGCPPQIYSLMAHCWQWDPSLRPNFNEARSILEHLMIMSGHHHEPSPSPSPIIYPHQNHPSHHSHHDYDLADDDNALDENQVVDVDVDMILNQHNVPPHHGMSQLSLNQVLDHHHNNGQDEGDDDEVFEDHHRFEASSSLSLPIGPDDHEANGTSGSHHRNMNLDALDINQAMIENHPPPPAHHKGSKSKPSVHKLIAAWNAVHHRNNSTPSSQADPPPPPPPPPVPQSSSNHNPKSSSSKNQKSSTKNGHSAQQFVNEGSGNSILSSSGRESSNKVPKGSSSSAANNAKTAPVPPKRTSSFRDSVYEMDNGSGVQIPVTVPEKFADTTSCGEPDNQRVRMLRENSSDDVLLDPDQKSSKSNRSKSGHHSKHHHNNGSKSESNDLKVQNVKRALKRYGTMPKDARIGAYLESLKNVSSPDGDNSDSLTSQSPDNAGNSTSSSVSNVSSSTNNKLHNKKSPHDSSSNPHPLQTRGRHKIKSSFLKESQSVASSSATPGNNDTSGGDTLETSPSFIPVDVERELKTAAVLTRVGTLLKQPSLTSLTSSSNQQSSSSGVGASTSTATTSFRSKSKDAKQPFNQFKSFDSSQLPPAGSASGVILPSQYLRHQKSLEPRIMNNGSALISNFNGIQLFFWIKNLIRSL